jgi:hypothetical protein
MSASPAKDLLILLRNAGFSDSAIGWGMQPDDPPRYITLKDSGGGASLHTHDGGETLVPTVQVLVRAEKGQDVWDDAYAALQALRGYNLTLGGTVYQAIQLQSSIADLGRDANNRREVSFNLLIHRRV